MPERLTATKAKERWPDATAKARDGLIAYAENMGLDAADRQYELARKAKEARKLGR